jgi:hypothetical protein
MSAQDSHLRLNRTEWLLTIGQALRADYDDLLEPLPDHLADDRDAVSAQKRSRISP